MTVKELRHALNTVMHIDKPVVIEIDGHLFEVIGMQDSSSTSTKLIIKQEPVA